MRSPRATVVLSLVLLSACLAGADDRPGPRPVSDDVLLRVLPESIVDGTKPRYRILNNTDGDIAYGHAYVLEQRVGASWQRLQNHRRCVFTLELLRLPAGATSDPAVIGRCHRDGQIEPLEEGRYRITKDIELSARERIATITATFIVRPR